ncbi:kinase domain-containing protein, partial [Pyronema domesticum]
IKITDFGVSKLVDHDNETQFRTNVGTKDLKAPELDILTELRDGEQYTTAVDIWSIECILWWLCNDCVPFKNTGKILDFYRMERLDQNSIWFCDAGFPQKWPTGRLMQRLFVVDPLQRITA